MILPLRIQRRHLDLLALRYSIVSLNLLIVPRGTPIYFRLGISSPRYHSRCDPPGFDLYSRCCGCLLKKSPPSLVSSCSKLFFSYCVGSQKFQAPCFVLNFPPSTTFDPRSCIPRLEFHLLVNTQHLTFSASSYFFLLKPSPSLT